VHGSVRATSHCVAARTCSLRGNIAQKVIRIVHMAGSMVENISRYSLICKYYVLEAISCTFSSTGCVETRAKSRHRQRSLQCSQDPEFVTVYHSSEVDQLRERCNRTHRRNDHWEQEV
jgi:hypothetical protein